MRLVLEFVRAEEGGDPHAFRTGVQEYLLRWPDGSYDAITIRWDDRLLADLATLRDPLRAGEAARKLGDWLQRLLAPTRWRERSAALTGPGASPSIDVEIRSAAAELYALPWELLTLAGSGSHLAGLPGLKLRYRWPGARAAPRDAGARREGGRIVLAWSSAFGPVGAARFADVIAAAARAGGVAFDPDKDILPDVSLAGLVGALEGAAGPPAILHILCHGVAQGGAFGLGLGTTEAPDFVDAGRVRMLAPFAGRVRLIVLTACDGAGTGAPGSHLGGVAQALHAVGFAAVVAARAPISGRAALEFSDVFYTELLGELATVDDAFARACRRLRLAASGIEWAQLQLHAHDAGARPLVIRPYRGLLPFEAAHARLFFGRGPECDEAVADLEALIARGKPRLLVVAGASGTGKSSVVLAGVVPRLAARGIAAAVMRPGVDPLRALDEALAAREGPGRFLLVVDQFEEIFTHADAGAGDVARTFARRLWQLAGDPAGDVAVVLTLRVDYLGRCGELALDDDGARLDQIAYDEAHRVFVAQMTRERLRETIDGPAARLGLELEAGLRERLLHEIGDEPSALPLLQYALDELWTRRDGDTLTHAALDALGGAVGALARRAEAVLEDMSEEEGAEARRLLVRMATYAESPASGTRRRRVEAELRPGDPARGGAWDRAVRALVDARLVVRRARDDGDVLLDISHEALLRRWPRLWSWYQEDRARLAEQAQLGEWVEEWRRFPDNLLTGNKLGFALRLRELHGDELSASARELVAASEDAERRRAEEERRRAEDERARSRREVAEARRRTRLTLAASVVLLAALVFSGLQWRAATRAEAQARADREASERNGALARTNLARSEARRLAGLAAVAQAQGEFERALLLAVEAARAEAELGADLLVGEVSQGLRDRLAATYERRILPRYHHAPQALAWSPDGAALAVGAGNVRVFRPDRDEPPRSLAFDGSADRLAWTPDGRRLLIAGPTGDVRVWTVDSEAAPWLRACDRCRPSRKPAALSPDGARVAVIGGSDRVDIVAIGEDRAGASVGLGDDVPVLGIEWAPSGALLAVGSTVARVWPRGPGSEPLTFVVDGEDLELSDAVISPDGTHVALVTRYRVALVALPADVGDAGPEGRRCRLELPRPRPCGGQEWLVLNGASSPRFDARSEHLLVLAREHATVVTIGERARAAARQGWPTQAEFREQAMITGADIDPAGEWLVTRVDGGGALWRIEAPAEPPIRFPSVADGGELAFDPSGRSIAAVGQWNVELWPFPLRRDEVELWGLRAVGWSADGDIVGLTGDPAIVRFSPAGQRRGPPRPIEGRPAAGAAFSPDGHVLAYMDYETHESVLVDVAAAEPVTRRAAGRADALAPVWSADGARVVVERDASSLLVRQRDGAGDRPLTGLPGPPTALAISRDGARIAAAAGPVLWWSLDEPDAPRIVREAADVAVERLEFDAAGDRLLVVAGRGAVVFSLGDPAPPRVLGSPGPVSWAGFGPTPGSVAVDSKGEGLVIRPLAGDGPELRGAEDEHVVLGAFSPDGLYLATFDPLAGRIALRRTDRVGEPAAAPIGPGVTALTFSPDGRSLLTHDVDGLARVVTATTAALVERACARVSRDLTEAERRQFLPDQAPRPTCPDVTGP